jgi:chromosome segregation ATPase
LIEQGIYFALGCIVTALAALAFAPLLWSRALRLSRRRLQLQVPLSMQEILAERDGLRAEFAVERLRIERAMERVQAAKAADMAAIGRHSVAAARLADEVAALRRLEQAQQAEIDRLLRELAETNAEAGAIKMEHARADERAARAAGRIQALETDCRRLNDVAESRRVAIASLERTAADLEAQLSAAKTNGTREDGLAAGMRNRLEIAMAHATRHETSSLSLRRELDEAKTRLRLLTAGERSDGRHQPDTEEADAGLRASIHALGLAVATMTREGRNGAAATEPRARRVLDETPSVIDAG